MRKAGGGRMGSTKITVLFEERDAIKNGANTETQSKNIDYDY